MDEKADIVEQYAYTLSCFLTQSEKCTQSLREAKAALDELRNAKEHQCLLELKQLREDFDSLLGHLGRLGIPQPDMEAEKLDKLKALLNDPVWPSAISPDHIVETVEGKRVRAKQILDLVVTEPLKELKFLDYGCGEGYVTTEASHRASSAIGYDIEKQWENSNFLTTDFKTVIAQAPYDIVLLYDVLDHCKKPVEELCKIRDLLSMRGRIYLRMHPWCGKHGGHLYKKLNKAHMHVIFNESELLDMFGECPFVQKTINPISNYRNWFMISGYNVIQESVIRDMDLHPFFTDMDHVCVQERIRAHWIGVDPAKDLRTNFVNYILEPNQSHKQVL